jgi:glucuronate isomerase
MAHFSADRFLQIVPAAGGIARASHDGIRHQPNKRPYGRTDPLWFAETAGVYKTAHLDRDTRAFCSIPARRNAARHGDCAFLATLVASGRQDAVDATEVTHDLAYSPAKQAHKL